MPSHHLVHGALLFFARFPKAGGVFGLLAAAAFGFLGVSSWLDLQEMPETPEALTLPEAILRLDEADDIWVELEGVEWDCGNTVPSQVTGDDRAEVVFTNESRTVLGVAIFSAPVTCVDLDGRTAEGVLSRMGDGFYERLSERGFDLTDYAVADARVHLCTYCGRGNSMLAIILAAIFVPIGLLMYPLCRYLQKESQKKGLI
jgi:hypothetical protein